MRKMAVVLLCFILILTVSSCGSPSEADLLETRNTDISPDLTFDHSMPLDYAEEFAVDYYNDGYALITISNGTQYLVIPEGKPEPSGLDENIVQLHQPIQNIYLVASAVMDMFVSMDALDTIRFSAMAGISNQCVRQWNLEIFYMLANIPLRIMSTSLMRIAAWRLRTL